MISSTHRCMVGNRSLGTAVLLVCCLAVPTNAEIHSMNQWAAEVSRRGVAPEDAVFVFEATPEMIEWARTRIEQHRPSRALDSLEELQRALFDTPDFDFVYEEALTLSAPEAFRQKRGNCMAFTSMFVALARGIGIQAVLVSVKTDPNVIRSDGLVIVNRHVVAGYREGAKLHLFDFYVTSDDPYVNRRVISDVSASAMYHANIGGSALRAHDFEEARRNLELATRLDPRWAPAWVNLGVVLHRQGHDDEAMHAYARALDAEPANPSALTNMATIYRKRGERDAERSALAAASSTTRNPFTLIAMADLEMNRGNISKARSYLRRARWWYPKEPEVYDALARLARREEDPSRVQRYENKAEELRESSAR